MRKEPSVRWCWKHILQRGVHFIPEGTGLDSTLGSINLHARLPKTGFGKPSSKWRDSLWSLQGGTQWLFFFLFSYFAKVRVPLGLLPVSIHSSFHHLPLVPFLCARHFGSLLSILNSTICESLCLSSPPSIPVLAKQGWKRKEEKTCYSQDALTCRLLTESASTDHDTLYHQLLT